MPRADRSDPAAVTVLPWGELALAAVLAALGGLGFVAAFRLEDLVRPVTVAAATGVTVGLVVTGILRRGAAATFAVAAPVLGLAAVAVCGVDAATLVTGLRDGPRTILTSALPAPSEPELLLVPFVATALAAVVGAELVQRSRLAIAPTLPSLLVFVVGLAFGGEGRLPPLWAPTAWVLVAALVTGWRSGGDADADEPVAGGAHGRSRPRSGRAHLPSLRAVAMVVLVAVPVAGGARWLGPRLPGAEQRERFDLRDLVDQPAHAQQVANPLIAVTAWQDGPDDTLFTATTSHRVERWRLAVLDAYDGSEWRSSAGFVPVGTELPPSPVGDGADEAEIERLDVTQTVEPAGLGGRWLPVVDRAFEVSPPGSLFDRAGGVLLVDGTELPERYTVRSAVPQVDPERLVSAAVADDDEARAALALPADVPEDAHALAAEIVKGAGSAYARAAAIERYLAASPDATFELATDELPSGHSVGHLRCFLFAPERCGRRGSTEQFVAAYALLARSSGLPTRVVVGFVASRTAGRDEVTAHDATAWAEVKLAGIGWVAFNPVPDPTVEITPPTTEVPGASEPPATQPAAPSPAEADTGASAEQVDAAASGASGSGVVAWVAGVLVAGVVLLALPALWRGQRRRRRRRARSAAGRIAGAWAAAIDELAATGATVTRAMAVADVVEAGERQLGSAAASLVPLGAVVNRAHFAGPAPRDHDAEQAWELSDRFRSERRSARPLGRRLREYLALRSPA
jgi:transglutaminase-like putative cysteine protease